MALLPRPKAVTPLTAVLLLFFVCFQTVLAQDCSATKLCASGCCSKYGYCGTDSDHCGAGCLSTCDFKLGCDASNPCSGSSAGTCCSKFGFCGLGPDYCAADVCVAGCDSKSYCDPGYSAPGYAEVENCPLNVCCSQYGFCGLTQDFCGNKTVDRPSCGTAGTMDRVMGYYEGWATGRVCDIFTPEDIPINVYTHINFAFASIDPNTFEVAPASTDDVDLYGRLTSLKDHQPGLKVFIAIGGWTFNDPGPTATTFSDIAGSDANMQAFFKSLISFMATYNFDGVDIDWEYPAADDRSGRPQDFSNFPYFLSQLKQALQGTDGRDGLSITIPASYWYLQHFDIINLSKSVDFFNMMTYDLHGAWDIGNKWLGAYLNAHTNLTEIKDSLDLLWRNGIPPAQVNLGLAFYARTSTLNPGGCALPGCDYASAGIQGPCSQSVGTLTNAELQPIIAQGSPTLYKDAAVKVITWDGNQWAAYDDVDTWTLKVDFAKSECLGGVFVWAISQDSSDKASSIGVATATGRTITQAEEDNSNQPLTITETYNQDQCKWSNCDQNCPSDFSTVLRNDKDKNYAGEIMQDDSYCDGAGKRVFCCPNALPQPACGWYNFNGGACNDPTCPSGYTEVGSSRSGCRGTWTYQAACCEVEDHTAQTNARVATALYNQCSWAGHTKSCAASCGNGASELVGSWAGSGAVRCDLQNGISSDQSLYYQYRPYCCDQPSNQQEFTNCNWYDSTGWAPRNKDYNTYCMSGCPGDMTRVAMSNRVAVPGDTFATKNCLKGGGAAAYCCDVVNNATREILNPKLAAFYPLVLAWAAQPACPADSVALTKRSLEVDTSSNSSAVSDEDLWGLPHVFRRDPADDLTSVYDGFAVVLKSILTGVWTQYSTEAGGQWDGGVVHTYPGLQVDSLTVFAKEWELPNLPGYGLPELTRTILCNPIDYNNQALAANGNNPGSAVITCPADICDFLDCNDPDDEDNLDSNAGINDNVDDSSIMNQKRGLDTDDDEKRDLDKRSGPQKSKLFLTRSGITLRWNSATWISSGGFRANDAIYNRVVLHEEPDDCGNTRVRQTVYTPQLRATRRLATEHIMELNTPQQFFADRYAGTVGGPNGATSRFAPYTDEFLNAFMMQREMTSNLPVMPGGLNPRLPIDRLMEALGSRRNTGNFMILWQGLNGLKSQNWRHVSLSNDIASLVANIDVPGPALAMTRDVISTWQYYNLPDTHSRLVEGANEFRTQLQYIQNEYNAVNLGQQPTLNLVGGWDEWIRNHFTRMANEANTFLDNNIAAIESAHASPATPQQTSISRAVNEMLRRQSDTKSVVDATPIIRDLDGVD